MKTANPLVEVDFIDQSNYVNPADTDDVVGAVVESDWGIPNKLTVLDPTTWAQFYNPLGIAKGNYSQSVIQRAFDAGASFVEVVRLASLENYDYVYVSGSGTSFSTTKAPYSQVSSDEDNVVDEFGDVKFIVRSRYPWRFSGYIRLEEQQLTRRPVGLSDSTKVYNVYLYLNQTAPADGQDDSNIPTEQFQVTLNHSVVGGESMYFADVINSTSRYLVVPEMFYGDTNGLPGDSPVTLVGKFTGPSAEITYTEADYRKAYELFKDRDQSTSTILINTYEYKSVPESFSASALYAMIDAAETRMDCVDLVGAPRSVIFPKLEDSENMALISQTFAQFTNAGKFTNELAAAERVKFLGRVYNQDGTATLAGRICAVARQYQNRNRLPSYKETGSITSVLTRSLKFENVVKLMDDTGIGSMYTSSTGNYLFNIETAYPLRMSYFARLNVMRVTASVLRWLLTDVEYVIHTEVVSDPIQLLSFQERCNKKLGDMIVRGELKSQSVINCGPEINTDALTNGGECLNIECYLWYKKLAKRVKIKIIASDTTTSVEFQE